jgi:3-dehydroquinate synthase II
MFIEAECKKKTIATILQNAETIRLTQPNGMPLSVVELKKGSKVLTFTEEAGRHFGMKIKETITEK